jgi:CheY-like chemotaxis protein
LAIQVWGLLFSKKSLTGTEAAEKLLLDTLTKNIPIIFMTAVVQKNEREEEAGLMGGRGFIAKPVSDFH